MSNFSVLISVYHREHGRYLHASLNSVFNQTLPPSEVVLVKDGPLTEGLDSVIADFQNQYDSLKVITLPGNVGLGKALTEGLKHCSCDLVARMDSDDICKPHRFERQIDIFDNNPEIDVVGAWIDEFENNTDNICSTRKLPESHNEIYKFSKTRNPINHPTVMFRKTAVEAVGGYKHFPLFEDYYLWARMLVSGSKFHNIQESLLFFRYTSDMVKRRGGLRYAITEIKFFKCLYSIGLISMCDFFKNISIRFVSRLIPNTLRQQIYSKILRE